MRGRRAIGAAQHSSDIARLFNFFEYRDQRIIRERLERFQRAARELRRLARARGTSMAALIRDAVDRTYGGTDVEARWRRALA